MCIYPKLLKNPKYKENKKNGGVIAPVSHIGVLYVPIGCGKCMDCMKKKGRDWQIRLSEEIKVAQSRGYFVTLTFSNESIKELNEYINDKGSETKGYNRDNEIATVGTRLFLERWRKKHKKSIRHWLITELGHNGTENIHIHGIIWTEKNFEEIRNIWKYGFVFPRNYQVKDNRVNLQTVNYIIKYVKKQDLKHINYIPKILCSSGIGNKFIGNKNRDFYTNNKGFKMQLPIYYRNKIYTDEEKEQLWIEKIEQGIRYIDGNKVKNDNKKEVIELLKQAQKKNNDLGYARNGWWKKSVYENEIRDLLRKERTKNVNWKDIQKINIEKGINKDEVIKKWKPEMRWDIM